MTAPFREPTLAQSGIEIWPPPFELGPKLTAAYVCEARRLRIEAIHRSFFRMARFIRKAIRH